MFFTVNKIKSYTISPEAHKANFYSDALFVIQAFPMRAQEQRLNLYLLQKYKKTLKELCIELLKSLTLYETEDNYLVLFKDPQDDTLAQLITYGNNLVGGSNILKIAFNQKRGW